MGATPEVGGPDGHSYGAVLVRAGGEALPAIEEQLRGIRFSGWIAPPRDGWIVVLGDPGAGIVAGQRRGVIDVAGLLAKHTDAPVFAVRVRRDRQLALVAWRRGAEIGRYSSDPSQEPAADADVLAEPVGTASGIAFAEAVDRADAAADLVELLGDELDPDSVFESERLREVLRLLGMPDWVVASGALPRDIPTGPRARELRRLRAGAAGFAGFLRHLFVRRARRRRAPAPVIADPPRRFGGLDGIEPWML
jgi:hypothetical protein